MVVIISFFTMEMLTALISILTTMGLLPEKLYLVATVILGIMALRLLIS